MYTVGERPFGKSLQEWTTLWWQWFFSISRLNHPACDSTGQMWGAKQYHTNVIFLAGTIGGSVERRITIPAYKAILVPIINYAISYAEDPELNDESELISIAKSNIEDLARKEAQIDGVKLNLSEDYRIESPPFDIHFPENNIYGVKAGRSRGSGDGYWLFLTPLSPGRHIIQTGGSCLSGRIKIDVLIHLTVEG
jgi:hypothetical protein